MAAVLLEISTLFETPLDLFVSSPVQQPVAIAVLDGPLDGRLQTPSIPSAPTLDVTSAESPVTARRKHPRTLSRG